MSKWGQIYSGAATLSTIAKYYLSVIDVDTYPSQNNVFLLCNTENVNFLIIGSDHSHVTPRTIAMPKVIYNSVFILQQIQWLHLLASIIFHSWSIVELMFSCRIVLNTLYRLDFQRFCGYYWKHCDDRGIPWYWKKHSQEPELDLNGG